MKGLWTYLAAAVFGFCVLAVAAVWMGGLNQDEGWYLYAAELVSRGKMPYRDFFFTQGPLLPIVYSAFASTWRSFGLLGARAFTLLLGTAGIVFAAALAYRLTRNDDSLRQARGDHLTERAAGVAVLILLGSNLYHLYYLTLPKTYALAGLFVIVGYYLLAVAREGRSAWAAVAGLSLAFAAGTRISLGALLAVVGGGLLLLREWKTLGWFVLGGFSGLALAYGPFLCEKQALAGLLAAQKYHAARGGFDVTWTVGSLSRLVRWYLPITVMVGMVALGRNARILWRGTAGFVLAGFLAVFAVQIMAPFPYEDYQVPVMGLLAVSAAVAFFSCERTDGDAPRRVLLVLGMTWACSFGSPLLEKWSTNGQDRFWSLKKPKSELAQLREVAQKIEALDPGGKDLLTQDLYLAIETHRKVPKGLEMGPFAMLTDAEWQRLLKETPCRIAAMSGYSFAIVPPACTERPVEEQMAFWSILKERYELVEKEAYFGQNATTLLVLRQKEAAKAKEEK